MNEQEINKSLEEQLKRLSKTSENCLKYGHYEFLKPITEAMIQIKHELIQPDYKKIFSDMNSFEKGDE